MSDTDDLAGLLPYAAEAQARNIRAAIEHGGVRGAAKHLGINRRGVQRSIDSVRLKAAKQGWAPKHDMTKTVPEGYTVKGTSTLYNADGEVAAQWVKSTLDGDKLLERVTAIIEAFKEEVPAPKLVKLPKSERADNLLNLHIITDFHLGMKAWREEAGEDWDVSIAEDLLMRWLTVAIERAPAAKTGVLAQLGDFLHWDGLDAVTPASKHLLDADTRFQKVVRVAIRCLRRIIVMMLQKYELVHLVVADANHDPAGSVWLREMFSQFYEGEPRLTVDLSADTYYCHEFGQTSLFFHHGHKRKPDKIDDVMVAKFREVFGRTKHSYCHMGHMHFDQLIESNLMIIEQHRTMAAKDAYAARGGWMSGRGAQVICYSSEFGEVGRQAYTPEMV